MARKPFILNLGKLMIATAWADGTLHNQEINALKELLFLLPDLTGEDWKELELYMASPVSEAERHTLLARVRDGIRTEEDKDLAIRTLERLVQIEDVPQDKEAALVAQFRQELEQQSTGLLATLITSLRRAITARSRHDPDDGRESRLEDFLKQTIYFQLMTECRTQGIAWSIQDEETARTICLAAGLLAHAAWVDSDVSDRECEVIARILMDEWHLPEADAQVLTRISRHRAMKGLDLVPLAKAFCARTTVPERRTFLRCLFLVANATDRTSSEEIEAIRFIAKALELSHQDFIDAKLSIPREDRRGL